MDYRELEPQLAGMWQAIMEDYGIAFPKWQGKNTKNGPCPLCGGTDRAHFRMTEGRISLFCRHCAADNMKSPEQIIMEYSGISFADLVKELSQYVTGADTKTLTQAKRRVLATPKTNMPVDHKQCMPDFVEEKLANVPAVEMHRLLNRFSLQYPYSFKATADAMYFQIENEQGAVINAVKIFDNNGTLDKQWLAGGCSYRAWHNIPACEVRQTEGIAWSVSLISGLRHWWKTGQEVRVMFDFSVMLHAVNAGLIRSNDTILCSSWQREQLPEFRK